MALRCKGTNTTNTSEMLNFPAEEYADLTFFVDKLRWGSCGLGSAGLCWGPLGTRGGWA